MKLHSVCLACVATLALTGSALAWEAQGMYLQGAVGWDTLNKIKIDFGNETKSLNTSDGIKAYLGGGWRFHNGLRLEMESNYTYHDMGSGYGGDVPLQGAMLNALYDYKLNPKWTLSFGGGMGYGSATIKAKGDTKTFDDGSTTTTYREQIYDGVSGFQWQLIAEASYAISRHSEFYVDYRYRQLEVDGSKVSALYATSDELMEYGKINSLSDHSLMVGFRYFLNAPPPPPPPAPPPKPAPAPPPPPPPPPVTSYMVFFDFDKAELTDTAKEIIASAVKTAKDHGFVHIKVVGHTDTVGSARYNMMLSQKRADAVKAQMIADGLADDSIMVSGKGFADLLVPTGKGVKEPQNRRAVIDLGK